MYICLCHGITNSQVETAIEQGAQTLKQLSSELKIGSQCGKCCQSTKQVLNKKLMQIAEPQPLVA